VAESLLDLVLAAAVLWLAWMALASRDIFRSVVFYIVFGLLMALAWVRLLAPDIALAEAAIGAGLTGALLLDAAGQLGGVEEAEGVRRPGWAASAVLSLATLGLGAVLLLAVLRLPREPGGLTLRVAEHIPRSGVDHPVTAVLLNFRAFDTWMEVAVLLVAVLAALVVRRAHDFRDVPVPPTRDPVLSALPAVVVPSMVLAAGYLLWLGTHAPGGAFQAGAVLASAGVLLLLTGHRTLVDLRGSWLRGALLAGVIAFLLAAVATLLAGGRLLELPPAHAGTVILLIESAVTISIGLTLAALFAGARVAEAPARHSGEEEAR
jgi:multisubunit Na+/H+ antiporter MnhB subunit